jgi:ribosome-associated translation inhibitor RaiA
MSTRPSEAPDKPHVEIDTQNCTLRPDEEAKVYEALTPLQRLVERFPVADLYITIYAAARSNDYRVKTSLLLPGKTIFTGDGAPEMLTAYLRCIRKLVRKVDAHKAELEAEAETRKQQKGTSQSVVPDQPVDMEAVRQAITDQDYTAFRNATLMYEEPVRKRAGRWVQRFPEVEAQLGHQFKLADLVEEVFLNAFEDYDQRPVEQRFGAWLEDLIDPSLQALLSDPDGELRNIDFVRTLRGEDQA